MDSIKKNHQRCKGRILCRERKVHRSSKRQRRSDKKATRSL